MAKLTSSVPDAVATAAAAIERAADGATEQLAVLQAEVAVRDAELERLQEICDDRQRVIQELSEHAEAYRRAAEERAGLVAALDFDVQRLRKDLERTAEERDQALALAQTPLRDTQLERLQEICDDRRQLIEELSEHAAAYRRTAEDRADLVAALDMDLQRHRTELERADRARNEALGVAETAAHALDEERQRNRITSSERDAELRAANRELETLHARIEVLEGALAARSSVIDELQAACEERLGLISRLSAEVETLRLVADERRILLETNEQRYRARDALADRDDGFAVGEVDWRQLAEERDLALQQLSAEAERRSVLLHEVTTALEERTREIEDLRRLTRAS